MSVCLIDDRGEVWPSDSRRLREAFDSPYSDGEFVAYAVANLGFAVVSGNGGSMRVRMRPSIVSEATWATVRQRLLAPGVDRVALTWLDEDWRDEILQPRSPAVGRIERLLADARRARPGDYLARLVPTERLHAASPLGHLVRNWPEFVQPSAQAALRALLCATLGDRYVVTRRNGSGRVLFQEFGAALYPWYETWRTCAVGAPIEEQPDRDYGHWVAAAYRAALDADRPMIAEVDTVVRWPHAGRQRLRYQRVLVPLHGAGDPPMLLGGSLLDNRIDLRVA